MSFASASATFSQLRLAGCLFAATLLAASTGCSMCCAPHDCDFGYTGGAWVRDNPSWGRVGSVFEPAGYKAIADKPTEEVPTPAARPSTDDEAPMPEPMDTPEAMPESTEPTPPNNLPSNMTSTPRLRRLQPYLPQN
jgi:hypothetical protein